jgi:predicted transcriptional regulator
MERDELSRRVGRPIYEINMTLTIMELKGLIKEEYGEIRRI